MHELHETIKCRTHTRQQLSKRKCQRCLMFPCDLWLVIVVKTETVNKIMGKGEGETHDIDSDLLNASTKREEKRDKMRHGQWFHERKCLGACCCHPQERRLLKYMVPMKIVSLNGINELVNE